MNTKPKRKPTKLVTVTRAWSLEHLEVGQTYEQVGRSFFYNGECWIRIREVGGTATREVPEVFFY